MERLVSDLRSMRLSPFERIGKPIRPVLLCGLLLLVWLTPGRAMAQTAPAPPAPAPTDPGRPSLLVGVFSTTSLGDCTDCEGVPYRTTPSVFISPAWSLNARADLGAEIMWVASRSSDSDRVRVTFLLASLQFRPWVRHGFFLRTGAGMAFVHNWVLSQLGETDTAFRSKAFALEIASGWEWRLWRHGGVQLFGAQHVGALGDLQTSDRRLENVMSNFWSLGGAIVFR